MLLHKISAKGKLLFRIVLFVTAAGIVSCSKKDIMPEPVGEPVPYSGAPSKSVSQLVDSLPYSLWKAAWKKSNINSIIRDNGSAYKTVLIPTDQAFQAAGWTMDKINAATAEELDKLLSYHIMPGSYGPGTMNVQKLNTPLPTLLKDATMPGASTQEPYIYRLYLTNDADSLWIDGKADNKISASMEATDGFVYPINHLLKAPEKTMLGYLESDPRFSMYLEVIRYMEEVYIENWAYGMEFQSQLNSITYNALITFFAPTNEAFRKSGFTSMDDVKAYVEKALPLESPYIDDDLYYVQPRLTMDSILFYHGLNLVQAGSQYTYPMNLGYFSNDLKRSSSMISGLMLRAGSQYNAPPTYIEFAPSTDNGQLKVKRFGSSKAPVAVIESDIKTLNGVIHVIDDGLLMP